MVRAPDVAHTAFPNQGGDFIGTEAATGADGHVGGILRHEQGWHSIGLQTEESVRDLVEGYRPSLIPW